MSAVAASGSMKSVVCPFVDEARRERFEEVVALYRAGDPTLFDETKGENRSTKVGDAFWRGWHCERFAWGRQSKLRITYRAGQLIRRVADPRSRRANG